MNRTIKAQLVRASKAYNVQEGVYCNYSHRDCMQNCLEGYNFCIRHILEDKTAPFKQCSYVAKSGRKCPLAAPKLDKKDGYCAEHARKALITRQRLSRKRRPKETADSLLEELASFSAGPSDVQGEPRRGRMHTDSIASKTLEYASSSDSEAEAPLVAHAWRDDCDSDAESVDSDQEDMLKYAGVYTTEEVAQILRDKLIRLQALYIDQFKRLKHVLLSKRRQYLQAYKAEREAYGSIRMYKNEPFQRDKYDKLLAMKRYHKKHGKEALLQRQSTQRRMQVTEGANYKPPTFPKCVFQDEGLKCNNRVVPLSTFCQKHILHDQAQMLYHPCPFADRQCGRPVPSLLGNNYCSLHQTLSQLIQRTVGSNEKEIDLFEEQPIESLIETDDATENFDRSEDTKPSLYLDEKTTNVTTTDTIMDTEDPLLPKEVKQETETDEESVPFGNMLNEGKVQGSFESKTHSSALFTLGEENDEEEVR